MLENIKLGSKNSIVMAAQYLLNYVDIGKAADTFDEKFDAFVKQFQQSNNLTADGIIGPKTWTKIVETLPTCSTSKNRTSVYTCAIQTFLNGLVIDGIYGEKTKKAVAAYQATYSLSVDGICGPKTWNSLIIGTSVEPSSSTNKQPVDYKQSDSRWGKIKYSTHTSSQTISNSGCGPTAMADIVATWWDKTVTPKEMAELSVNNGFRTYNSGTSWDFFEFCAKKYKATKFIQTSSITTLKSALNNGAYAIVSFGPSKWTNGGHFCCIWKWDGTYFYINDPASSASNRAKGTTSEVESARKQFFIFYNEKEEKKEEPPKTTEEYTYNPNGIIIDISKWDGNINFDKFQPAVALTIARAACGSDPDPKFDEYATEMKKRKMPFGVYGYSYAATVEKGTDEAKKIYEYANKYEPLFYVYDIEENRNTKEAILAWVEEMRRLTKKRLGAYIGQSFYAKFNFAETRQLFDFIWIPRYGLNNGDIPAEKYHPIYPCDMWQYTSTGEAPGIQGNVDLNLIMTKEHDLEWFIKG